MKLTNTVRVVSIVVFGFLSYTFLKEYFTEIKTNLDRVTHSGVLSYFLTYLLIGIHMFVGTRLINSKVGVLKNLGLKGNVLSALGLAMLFSAPMFIGGLLFFVNYDAPNAENLDDFKRLDASLSYRF